MKRKLLVSLVLIGIIATSVAVGAFAATDIKLLINGKQVNADIQIVDGLSYVPLRVISESLGADVIWDGDSRTITINGKNVETPKSGVKSYDVDVNVESGPMQMKISKVSLDPAYQQSKYDKKIKAVVMDVSVENTSDDTISWYPVLDGKLALNTKEQIDRSSFQSDNVDGDFIGKIVKPGKIVFEVKGDLDKITSFNYVIRGAYDKEYNQVGEDKTVVIVLK